MPQPGTDAGGGGEAAQAGLPLAPLASTVVLAAITGYVDAYAYQFLFGTFPANQSGNIVLLGIAIGQGEWTDMLTCLVAVLGFGVGVAAGVALGNRASSPAYPRTRWVLLIELVVLVAITVIIGVTGEGRAPMQGPGALALLAGAAFAMGVQTPVIVRTYGVPTPTTYMTGSVAHLAEELTDASQAGPSRELRRRRARHGALLAVVLAGYVAGAAAGTAIGSGWNLALVVPSAVLGLLLVVRTGTTVGSRSRGHRPGP